MTVRFDGLTIDWLGYACARIESADGTVVYVDPGRYGTLIGEWESRYGGVPHPHGDPYDERDGDLVLVTHDHHYQSDGVRRVAAEDATVLVYEEVDAARVVENGRDVEPVEELPYDVQRVAYGDELTAAGVDVEVIPAYNEEDGPNVRDDGTPMHPYGFGCAFRYVIDGHPIFWTGDSDAVEEFDDLDVSILLPTIARTITMNRHDAAELAARLDPDLVVPIHYNTFEGLRADSAAFAADVAGRGVPVALTEEWPDWL